MKSEVYAYLAYAVFLGILFGYSVFLYKKRKKLSAMIAEN